MIDAFLKISKQEGLTALYRGVFPALLRQASYGTLKIGLYHTLKGVITPDPLDERLLTNVCAGVISGAVSSAIANPTDVLKVRMQAGGGFKAAIPQGASTATAFVSIYQLEGIRGLYRGVGPTAQRAAIVAGVLLPAYDLCKNNILRHTSMTDTPSLHLM